MPLGKILKTIGISSVFSFFAIEVLFIYMLEGGILRFPENIIVFLFVLSACFYIQILLVSFETVVLTLYTSVIALIYVVNYFFGTSTNPSILANYITMGGTNAVVIDFLLLGLLGSSMWLIVLALTRDFVRKATKVSVHQALHSLRARMSHIMTFLDKHPWLAAVVVSIITFIAGVLFGTRS